MDQFVASSCRDVQIANFILFRWMISTGRLPFRPTTLTLSTLDSSQLESMTPDGHRTFETSKGLAWKAAPLHQVAC